MSGTQADMAITTIPVMRRFSQILYTISILKRSTVIHHTHTPLMTTTTTMITTMITTVRPMLM